MRRGAAHVRFRLRRGLDPALGGAPDPTRIEPGPEVSAVALLGADAPGVSPELRVGPGDRVRLGQALWVDRRRPEVRFTAPGAGVVRAVQRGPRRRLEAVVIALEGRDEEVFDAAPGATRALSRERLQALMLASGLWTALRTRPFSAIPDPGSAPRSLFVTACESEPLAPPAELVIAESRDEFARGVAALTELTEGPVYVCTRAGGGVGVPEHEGVVHAEFDGPHPAGLPGTHIHFLDPAGPGRCVWHIAYPDVIALGRLLATGRLATERVVALAGPALGRPRLVRTRTGASTDDLVRGELRGEAVRVISGSALAGREATGWSAFLGRLHTQVCALPEGRAAGGTSLGGRRSAFYPLERLERVVPLDLLVVPLLRALLVGDVETAVDLGCLELAEEDLSLVSFVCPGKLEYGALLRSALDEIARQGR